MIDNNDGGPETLDRPSVEEQLEDTRHKLQRLAADFDNFRKRTHREKEDLQVRALGRFLLSLLPVVDDLERAVEHLDVVATGEGPEVGSAGTVNGLRMITERLGRVLEAEGLRRFRSAGERFTPRRHEAVDHVYHDEVPAGYVIRESAPGYEYGDEVLRPARVVVSRGPESDSILFEFDIEEEESTEPNRRVPEGLDDDPA
jgi:molecular chaperone GrpE